MKIMIIFVILTISFSAYAATDPGNYEIDNIYGDYLLAASKKKITMNLEGADLIDVLKALSQQSGLNFVSTEAVKDRKLTFYLDNVPLKDAMDIIFSANGLSYDYFPESNIFVVKEMGKPSVELKTKVYYLQYIRLPSSTIQQQIDDVMRAGSSSSGDSSTDSSSEADNTGIVAAVKGVLTDKGKVTEDPENNALIVVDVPSQFKIIDELIKKLDVPQPRVMIEVEMLDVSKDDVDKLGIDWPEVIAKLDVPGVRATSFPFYGKHTPNTGGVFEELTTPGGVEFSGLNSKKFAPSVLTLGGAQFLLRLLKTQTDAKFLARPKILTLSNETAEIKITTDEAIGVQRNVEDNGGETYTIERTETGTSLRVTPQVNPQTGEITMFLEMVVREAKDSGFSTASENFITGTIKNPEERSTNVTLRIKDGQTILIGGLIHKKNTLYKNNVPFFSKIPLLGAVFRYKNNTGSERELLVFLTPHIIKDTPVKVSLSTMNQPREQSFSRRQKLIDSFLDRFTYR